MSKVEDPRIKWDATFADNVNLSDLRAAVRRAPQYNPCVKGYRSVCWKAFLLYQNLDRSAWSKSTRDSRSAYGSLKEHLMQVFDTTSKAPTSNDPLAEIPDAPWQSLKQDEALRAEILQDVERCMPEISFFRRSEVQAMLLNVLFVYCKINADLGYRQGMHELLAPILWVVHQDATTVSASSSANQDKIMSEILDLQFVEHDAFSLFCIVMQTAKSFYEMTSGIQQSPGSKGDSPIVERSRRIHEEYLSKADPELANHLTSIDILPQIFVIRWIRLLFGREFPFEHILCLWDMIFAEDPALTLVDHVCLAMLLRIRWQLLEADYSSALSLLLRYPEPKNSQDTPALVSDAVYLSKHMDLQGGSMIIRKYSGKSPLAALAQSGGEPIKRKGAHTPHTSVDLNRTLAPLRSSADYIQNHGGIEAILQGAAKNVYSRSEQWGLNKAIRGAVQNFQNNTLTPPRQQGNAARWSLDDGRVVRVAEPANAQALKALEERNQAISGMLSAALEELNEQARNLEDQGSESAATALTLTTAKLHYLQVYLQDPQLPLDPDMNTKKGHAGQRPTQSEAATAVSDGPPSPSPVSRATTKAPITASERRFETPVPIATKSTFTSESALSPTNQYQQDPLSQPNSSTTAATEVRTAGAATSPRARPSLTESSYSWMLGDEKGGKTDFMSSEPFVSKQKGEIAEKSKTAARGKASFLFGDDGAGEVVKRAGGPRKPVKKIREADDDDGFTSPTLKGGTPAGPDTESQPNAGPL